MSIDTRPQTVTAAQYAEIFATERAHAYPAVDALEQRLGFAVDRGRLEAAARVLSCPFKVAAPNWQHGRVIYAVTRKRLATLEANVCASCAYELSHSRTCSMPSAPKVIAVPQNIKCLDIGTAKGFSALCALWALDDAGSRGVVTSVDVLPPDARVRRNTPAEVDGLKTLDEILAPWPEARRIEFRESTGIKALNSSGLRIHCAFIDGKHSTEAVGAEWRVLASRQQAGDVAIFDDVQMPAVKLGLKGAEASYDFETLALGSVNRAYAIGVRK